MVFGDSPENEGKRRKCRGRMVLKPGADPLFATAVFVGVSAGNKQRYLIGAVHFTCLFECRNVQPLDAQSRALLLDIIEDRHGKRTTIITSQVPVKNWHEVIGEKTLADAILDRIVHQSIRIELYGESLRKKLKPKSEKIETTL